MKRSREPTFIVVMGVSGAGKTTVGRALAERLGWPFHDADDFHPAENVARMRAGHPLTDADRAPWLGRLRDLIGGVLRSGGSAVLACSALRRAYRAALVPADAPPGAVRFAYLRVPRAELAERLTHRAAHYMPASLLDSQLATLEVPGPDEDALAIAADCPVADIVEEIVGWVMGRES
jgi:gluconokinase